MSIEFKKATKEQCKLRMALQGPAGGGKTKTALKIAKAFGGKVLLIDTEYKSASKYAHEFEFDTFDMRDNYSAERWMELMAAAAEQSYDTIVLDSFTHAWNGEKGILDRHAEECKKIRDSFTAWAPIKPIWRKLVRSIQSSPAHVIACLRAKQDYEKEKDGKTGKNTVVKLGMGPEGEKDFQYEMDIEGMFDMSHNFIIGKTRCDELDGRVFPKPGEEFAMIIKRWLEDGAPAATPSTELPTPSHPISSDQASEISGLIDSKSFPQETVLKWWNRCEPAVSEWSKFPEKHYAACLKKVQEYQPA